MSTRAMIGIENEDGTVTSIWTHWDGYPEHHGPILLEHYNTAEKVRELLALGDLSVLGKEIGEKHSFNERHGDLRQDKWNNWCLSYLRDRGENCPSSNHTMADWPEERQDYDYLFNRRGIWMVREYGYAKWKFLLEEVRKLVSPDDPTKKLYEH